MSISERTMPCLPIKSVSKTFGQAPHQYDWIINLLDIILPLQHIAVTQSYLPHASKQALRHHSACPVNSSQGKHKF